METSIHPADLHSLGQQLQSFFDDLPVRVQCAIRDERLIVLGQHPEDISLDASHLLKVLERKIQSLQLTFTQQVRLYLRIWGQRQPYAHRWFMIQPPPPPVRRFSELPSPETSMPSMTSAVEEGRALALSSWLAEAPDVTDLDRPVLDREGLRAIGLEVEPSSGLTESPQASPDIASALAVQVAEPFSPLAAESPSDEAPWVVGDEELDELVQQLTATYQMRESMAIAPLPQGLAPDIPADELPAPPDETKGIAAATGASPSVAALSPNVPDAPDAFDTPDASCEYPVPYTGGVLSPLTDAPESDGDASRWTTPLPLAAWQHRLQRVRSLHHQTEQHIHMLSRTVLDPMKAQWGTLTQSPLRQVDGRMAIAAGVTVLGLTGATYTLTRPCAVGGCPNLSEAKDLSDTSTHLLRQAETWQDLERASTHLQQAVETLEPIPLWSGYSAEADQLMDQYSAQLAAIATLLEVEETANVASQTSQEQLYSIADWEAVRSLWAEAISKLEVIPPESEMYGFARHHLRRYRAQLLRVDQQIQREHQARRVLDNAKQAAQLAEARQGAARNLEQWQFARVTWVVALDRLNQVPDETLAHLEAEELKNRYQTSLDLVNRRVAREQAASRTLAQAEQHGRSAEAAEQRLDWQQAVSHWTHAMSYAEQVEAGTSPQPQAEELLETYSQFLAKAEENRQTSDRIRAELETTCIGEIRICNLLSVGRVVKVGLDDGYVAAIDAARSSGNNQLQAVVTDHQLILRRALELIANQYDLPVEVYTPENELLERHSPQS